MKISCGIDIIEIQRIQQAQSKFRERWLNRIFTGQEQLLSCEAGKNADQRFAGRFAAKEAVSKALGTGIGNRGIKWTDIEILKDDLGAPVVILHNHAKSFFQRHTGESISVSISHNQTQAVAVCNILWSD